MNLVVVRLRRGLSDGRAESYDEGLQIFAELFEIERFARALGHLSRKSLSSDNKKRFRF